MNIRFKQRAINFLKSRKEIIFDVGIILLLGCLSFTWFRGSNLISGGDFGISLDWEKVFKLNFSAWDKTVSLGMNNTATPFLFLSMFCAFLQTISFSVTAIEKTLFLFWFAGSGLSMYFLCSVLGMKRLARLASSIFFMMNPFSLIIIWRVSHGMIQLPYAITPLVLGLYINGLKKEKGTRYVFFSSLVLAILSAGSYANPRSLFFYFFPVLMYFLSVVIFQSSKRIFIIKYSLKFLLFFVLFNLYWLYPFVHDSEKIFTGVHSSVLMSDIDSLKLTSVDLLKAIRMTGYWSMFSGYQGEPYYPYWQYYTRPLIALIGWFIPILIFLGFFQKEIRKKQLLFFYLGILVIGLFGIKGSLSPLGSLSVWLYKKIPPLLLAARFSFLFYGVPTFMIFSILLGYGFLTVYSLGYKIFKKYVIFFIAFLFICLNVILVFPFWNGEVIKSGNNTFPGERFRVPDYWREAREWLVLQPDFFRILPLPMSKTYNVAFFWGDGYSGTDPIRWLSPKPALYTNSGFALSEVIGNIIEKNSDFKSFSKILKLLNVKYLVLRNDTRWDFINGHDWWFSQRKDEIYSFLGKQKNIVLEKEFGPLQFFRVEDSSLQNIYIPEKLSLVEGNSSDFENIVEFLDEKEKQTIIFSDDQKTIGGDISFTDFDNYFICREPIWGDENNDLTKAIYTLNTPLDGNYGLYLRDDKIYDYYQFLENVISFEIEGKTERRTLKKYGDNLFYLGDLFLSKGLHRLVINVPQPKNLIENPSFENGLWQSVGASSLLPGKEKELSLSSDAVQGTRSAALKSTGKFLAISSAVKGFRPSDSYSISFFAKGIKNPHPYALIWQNNTDIPEPILNPTVNRFGVVGLSTSFSEFALNLQNDWQHYLFLQKPISTSQTMGITFAEGLVNQAGSESLFDSVVVNRMFYNPIVLKYVKNEEKKKISPQITFKEINWSSYEVDIKDASEPFPLVFSDSFDNGWESSIKSKHFVANGFANGWYINQKGDFSIKIEYKNQRSIKIYLGICFLSMFLPFVYFVWLEKIISKHFKRKKNI